jgi:hypothetical protein
VEHLQHGMQIARDACRVRRVAIPSHLSKRKKTESKAAHLSSENPLASILSSYCSSSDDRLVEFLVNSLTRSAAALGVAKVPSQSLAPCRHGTRTSHTHRPAGARRRTPRNTGWRVSRNLVRPAGRFFAGCGDEEDQLAGLVSEDEEPEEDEELECSWRSMSMVATAARFEWSGMLS